MNRLFVAAFKTRQQTIMQASRVDQRGCSPIISTKECAFIALTLHLLFIAYCLRRLYFMSFFYFQNCPSCLMFQDCVQCTVHKTGPLNQTCQEACSDFETSLVPVNTLDEGGFHDAPSATPIVRQHGIL